MTITTIIIFVSVIVSLVAFSRPSVSSALIFNPYIIHQRGEWYRFITSGLIHADFFHLLINMFVLYSFGPIVEQYYQYEFGEKGLPYFLTMYLGGLLFSILPTYRKHLHNPGYNALGASGAVSAVVFSFILFNPLDKLCLYGILCLPGILFGAGYLIYCYYMDKKGRGRINHDAHLWGAVFGFLFTILLKPSLLLTFFSQLIYFRQVI